MIEWSVLGVSRQYYTFREKDIISKVKAGGVLPRFTSYIHKSTSFMLVNEVLLP